MAGLGFGITFLGYSVFYYGLTQVNGFNYGFLDLLVPSKWLAIQNKPPAKDDGTSAASSTVSINGKKVSIDTNPLTSLAGAGAGKNYNAFKAAANNAPAVIP